MFNPVVDICFLTCICLWQILHIQTCLRVVVGPGLVTTSPAFMRSIASHPAGPHGRLTKKRQSGPHCWEGSTQFAQGSPDRCDSSTACRLCRLEPYKVIYVHTTKILVKNRSLLYIYVNVYFFCMCSNYVFFLNTSSTSHYITLSCICVLCSVV